MRFISLKTSDARKLRSDARKSITQLSLNVILYCILYITAIYTLESSLIIFSLSILFLAFIIVRLFIIQHDCAHYSYLKKVSNNNTLGFILASLTHVPHRYWLRQHAYHHAHSGNLEGRNIGDIKLLTTSEYKKLSKREQLIYRLYRNPFIMVVIGSLFQFFIWFKNPFISDKQDSKSRNSILLNNLLLLARITAMSLIFSWQAVLIVEALSLWIASMFAIMLFYVQHNFKDAYWRKKTEWDHKQASLTGSSFLNLCSIGHWLTGNIGYHHIHHLDSKIPNYLLPKAHQLMGTQSDLNVLNLKDIPKTFSLKLWDENTSQLVKFGA